MAQRPQEGNVTWVNFGQRKKVSSAEEARLVTGERVDSKQVLKARAAQEPEEPVFSDPAQVIYNAAMRATDQGRFTRGRRYAEGGNVLDLRVESGRFVSTVAGSQNEPFNVMVLLPYREAGCTSFTLMPGHARSVEVVDQVAELSALLAA